MPHRFLLKVYYEDTDAGGVVYYANYLRYMERARTEYLAELGVSVSGLHEQGTFLVVTHLDITYRRPARLGETLAVATEFTETRSVKATLRQRVLRGEELLVDALLTFAAINRDGRPLKLPPELARQGGTAAADNSGDSGSER